MKKNTIHYRFGQVDHIHTKFLCIPLFCVEKIFTTKIQQNVITMPCVYMATFLFSYRIFSVLSSYKEDVSYICRLTFDMSVIVEHLEVSSRSIDTDLMSYQLITILHLYSSCIQNHGAY